MSKKALDLDYMKKAKVKTGVRSGEEPPVYVCYGLSTPPDNLC